PRAHGGKAAALAGTRPGARPAGEREGRSVRPAGRAGRPRRGPARRGRSAQREAELQDPRGAAREDPGAGGRRRARGGRRDRRPSRRRGGPAGRGARGPHCAGRARRPPAQRGGQAKSEGGGRINQQIRAREVRVIDSDGAQLGVMTPPDAQRIADQKELDLVEVAPTANPPVCRIMDYGKYKYAEKKKAQASRKKNAASQLKEVK